jgi:Cu/Ag efflux protein CusF
MKTSLLVCLALLLPLARASEPGLLPAPAPVAVEAAPEPKSHPLKGVVIGVMTEKTALLVKHEEVPGVMRAMTMMFKVDPAVLEKVQRGDAITALMSRRADGWWLTEVEIVAPAK